MTDRIHITNLRLRTKVGIRDWEQEKRQDVIINITLHSDQRAAAESDDIAHTVDYKAIKKQIVALVEGGQFNLVERLAQEIANLCLKTPGVEAVDVRVEKPGALRFADNVGVEIRRP